MKLAVISHKLCWQTENAPEIYQTDGGFPLQIKAISELFDETRVVVPCEKMKAGNSGTTALAGRCLTVAPLTVPQGKDFRRKLDMPFWFLRNSVKIWREVRRADAVHAPIPGDVGTIGMLFAIIQRKPLFVRHCGNWLVQKTAAETFWRWAMERFAGGRNVMLATGGNDAAPSEKNAQIKWIFSTSLKQSEIAEAAPRSFPENGQLKIITACRLERKKGVETVIESLPLILKKFPESRLDIVGGGSLLEELKKRAGELNLNDRLTFHGKVEQSRVIELMKQAHVFCFPTQASEGFPKVALEALAAGLPVVTTRVSVLPQLISEKNGVLLEAAEPENVAAAVEKLFADPRKYETMSANAVASARGYTLENWRDTIGETLKNSWQVASLCG